MKAYILSLKPPQHDTNLALAQGLAAAGFGEVRFVAAVDGRLLPPADYFAHILKCAARRGLVLSPAEVGCALSHAVAWEAIAADGEDAFVFEDDVILTPRFQQQVAAVHAFARREAGFLHLGGMEGLEAGFRTVRCRVACTQPHILALDTRDLIDVQRAVGYWLNADTARWLLERRASVGLCIPDDYSYFWDDRPFHYCNLVSHPLELDASTLESARQLRAAANEDQGSFLRMAWRKLLVRLRLAWRRRVRHWQASRWTSRHPAP